MTGVWYKRENAWVLVVPEDVAAKTGARVGEPFEFAPILDVFGPLPSIKELCAGITPENRHGETDWGPPRGCEVW